jgi:hypothetical protein
MFRALTFYTPEAVSPRAELPAGAGDVVEEQVSRFYYCLRFRMPAPRRRSEGAEAGRVRRRTAIRGTTAPSPRQGSR